MLKKSKKYYFIIAILLSSIAGWTQDIEEKAAKHYNIFTQPLEFFFNTVPAGFEYGTDKNISVGGTTYTSLQFIPPWNKSSGWHGGFEFDAYLKYYFIGESFKRGFYLLPLVGIGYTRRIAPIESYMLGYFARNHIYRIPFTPDNLKKANFINVDVGAAVGYDWHFETDISVDLAFGFKATNVFILGAGGGYFYTLPIPFLRFGVGYTV